MLQLQQELPIDVQQYVPQLIDVVATILTFTVVFLVVYWVGRSVSVRAVENSMQRRGFDRTLTGLAASLTAIVTTVIAIGIAATVSGFGTVLAAVATLGGAIALAIGFAAQDLIANFVAGVFIIRDKPFVAGDWIEWDGKDGVVREVRMRVTKLDTFDNELVTVPNGELANAAVFNNVANDRRRVSVDFNIGYDDDIARARTAVLNEGARLAGVLEDPEPTAPVAELADSMVVLSGRIWIDPAESDYGVVRSEFVEAVKRRFDAEGIDAPYSVTELAGGIDVTNASPVEGISPKK